LLAIRSAKNKTKEKTVKTIKVGYETKAKHQARKKEYERKYVSKFKKLQKTKLEIAALEQKLRLSQIELEEPKPSIKQKRREYEKEYITRYTNNKKQSQRKKYLLYVSI